MERTGNERLLFDKTFWRWWRWIHVVCLYLPNDMVLDDCPQLRPDKDHNGGDDDDENDVDGDGDNGDDGFGGGK